MFNILYYIILLPIVILNIVYGAKLMQREDNIMRGKYTKY